MFLRRRPCVLQTHGMRISVAFYNAKWAVNYVKGSVVKRKLGYVRVVEQLVNNLNLLTNFLYVLRPQLHVIQLFLKWYILRVFKYCKFYPDSHCNCWWFIIVSRHSSYLLVLTYRKQTYRRVISITMHNIISQSETIKKKNSILQAR